MVVAGLVAIVSGEQGLWTVVPSGWECRSRAVPVDGPPVMSSSRSMDVTCKEDGR